MNLPETFYDEEARIWYGEKTEISVDQDISLGQAMLEKCQSWPERIVEINHDTGDKLTAQDILEMSTAAARNLQILGLEQEDVLGIVASNVIYLTPIVVAGLVCGTPINALSSSFSKEEIKHMFGITRPKIIFVDAALVEIMKKVLLELKLNSLMYTTDEKHENVKFVEELFKASGETFKPPILKRGIDQTALIMCTSGTTGLAKGICLSHRGLSGNLSKFILSDPVFFCFSSLYWFSGMKFLMESVMNGAIRIISKQDFSVNLFAEIVKKYSVTTIFISPYQIMNLLNFSDVFNEEDLSSLQVVVAAGTALNPNAEIVLRRILTKYGGMLLVGYGMTEAIGIATMQSPFAPVTGSAGNLLPNREVKIINDEGTPLESGEQGEICIRTPFRSYYYNNPEATQMTFDSDGWIHSGDIGYMDKNGNLFVVDRKKDILRYTGFNYYPTEIENVILEIPDVIEVCVCGVPDLLYNDLPTAAVVVKKGFKITAKEISSYVANKLSRHKHLHGGVYFLNDLPKTASGKAQRHKVRDILIKLSKKSIDNARVINKISHL